MTSHYKLYEGMGEVIPFNARYSFPTQANRAWKSVMKIPPKNGAVFSSNQNTTIRLEFPSSQYLNTANSFLEFDLTFIVASTTKDVHLQNNAQSVFKRSRWTYGSMAGEDIRENHVLVRQLTEGTGTSCNWITDQTSISDGVGGITMGVTDVGDARPFNTRNQNIQTANNNLALSGLAVVNGAHNITRRYQVQLALGLFQQNKLIPLKWMSSQFVVELELAPFLECICASTPIQGSDYYQVSNVNYVAELLEFDGTYDSAFLEGLRNGGVPLKFSSWDTFIYTPSPSNSQHLMIPERNRSIKAGFCVQLPPKRCVTDQVTIAGVTGYLPWDSHAFLESSAGLDAQGVAFGWLMNYQWRIGGKYYPSQPVVCGDVNGSNGAVEAYQEYAKALNIVGDFRLSTSQNTTRWARMNGDGNNMSSCIDWWGSEFKEGSKVYIHGPSSFVIAGDFETSNGTEISGLNGEEQNDIALMINYYGKDASSGAQHPACQYLVFVYYDALMILKEDNQVELIK